MKAALVLSLVVLVSAFHNDDPNSPMERDEVIKAVNNAKTTWKAGRNFGDSYRKHHLKFLLGLKKPPGGSQLPPWLDDGDDFELPKSFDARKKWSYCKALQEVRDQGPCGSCWAVSTASAFTDRLCIATEGKFNGHLSAEDVLTCSGYGDCPHGGSEVSAWQYFRDTGICTGGDYGSQEGCQPYTPPPCEHCISGPRKNCSYYHPETYPTPECRKDCYNEKYNSTKDQDLHKGVYQHIHGDLAGGHAVKVIGWGTEDGTDYWLVANSWNSDWGDKGFFKIRRGTDECGFESEISLGYPAV